MAQSSHQLWEEFFKRYYKDAINDLAESYPEKRSLWVKFSDIEKFDPDLGRELIDHPDPVLKHANEAIVSIDLPVDVIIDSAHVRIIGLPERIQIRELRSSNINKFISVAGLIRKATEVRPKVIVAAFKCQRCDHVTMMPQGEGKFVEPFECENDVCGRKGPFKLVHEESEFIDAQKLRVQESPDDLRGGEQPQTLDVDVDDDLAGIVAPGDRVVISGVLRSFQRTTQQGKSTFFDLVLDGVSIGLLYLDHLIEERVVVEEKAVSHPLTNDEVAQVITYLCATGNSVGLLLNFGRQRLEYKRIFPPKNVARYRERINRYVAKPHQAVSVNPLPIR